MGIYNYRIDGHPIQPQQHQQFRKLPQHHTPLLMAARPPERYDARRTGSRVAENKRLKAAMPKAVTLFQ